MPHAPGEHPGPEDAGLAGEVAAWVSERWDPTLTLGAWWRCLVEGRWAVPTWPPEWYGRGCDRTDHATIMRALRACRVPGPPAGLGILLAGPTILAHGTDDQKRRHLPGIVDGSVNWCQLFSEPDAGSDLASLRTTGRRDGDRWIVSGQKVWTSNANLADWGMLLVRTSREPKSFTWFAIDMGQPEAISVRPLREMTGRTLFYEVHLDGAVVQERDAVGGVGAGWVVARTTLGNERAGLSSGSVGIPPGGRGGALSGVAGDAARRLGAPRTPTGTSMAMRGEVFDLVRQVVGPFSDPLARQRLASLYTLEQVARYMRVTVSARPGEVRAPGSLGKLLHTRIVRAARDLALASAGPGGTIMGEAAPLGGSITELALFSPAVSIYGGTDEVQRNIIGERVLGLPRT